MPKFEWPCDKRRAHPPHIAENYPLPLLETNCPGVMAHPATQIGGNHLETRPDERANSSLDNSAKIA